MDIKVLGDVAGVATAASVGTGSIEAETGQS